MIAPSFRFRPLFWLLILTGLAAQPLRAAPAGITDEECQAFGTQLAGYFGSGDQELVVRQLDAFAYLDRIAHDFGFDEKEMGEFRGGALTGMTKNLANQFRTFNQAKYLRPQVVDGEKRALVRCINEQGAVNYFAFVLGRRASGGLKWVDVFIYLTGETMAETARRAVLPLVTASKKSLLAKLAGKDGAYVQNFPKISHAVQTIQQGKYAEALTEFGALPAEVQNERFVLTLRLRAAQAVNETEYLKVITAWEKAHPGDPALDLVSLDGDIMRKDYPKALKRVTALNGRVGGDPYLDFLKGNIQMMAGDNAGARRTARAVLAAEPEILGAWDTLLTVSLNEKKYADTVAVLGEFHQDHPRADMKTVIDAEPSYADFRASAEYRGWVAGLAAAK